MPGTPWVTHHLAGQTRISWLVEALLVIALLALTWQLLATAQRQAATQAQLEQVRSALARPAFVIAYDEQTMQGVQVAAALPTAQPVPAPSPARRDYVIAYDHQTAQGVQVTRARP